MKRDVKTRDCVLDFLFLCFSYGGFEVSLTPFYSGSFGCCWLAKGGVFVSRIQKICVLYSCVNSVSLGAGSNENKEKKRFVFVFDQSIKN
jgi:hypothetical protein